MEIPGFCAPCSAAPPQEIKIDTDKMLTGTQAVWRSYGIHATGNKEDKEGIKYVHYVHLIFLSFISYSFIKFDRYLMEVIGNWWGSCSTFCLTLPKSMALDFIR